MMDERKLTPEEIALYLKAAPTDAEAWLAIDARLHDPAIREALEKAAPAPGEPPDLWSVERPDASLAMDIPMDIEEALIQRYVRGDVTPVEREIVEVAMEHSLQVTEAVRTLQQFQEQLQHYDWTAVQGVLADPPPHAIPLPEYVTVTAPGPHSLSQPAPGQLVTSQPATPQQEVRPQTSDAASGRRPRFAAALASVLAGLRGQPAGLPESAAALNANTAEGSASPVSSLRGRPSSAFTRSSLRSRWILIRLSAALACGMLFAVLIHLNGPPTASVDPDLYPPKPANLDFSQGVFHTLPTGWFVPPPVLDAGYQAQLVPEGDRAGHHSVLVTYNAALASPESKTQIQFGNVMQAFDATVYRGKRVRFRAFVRSQGAPMISHAQLWLRVDRQNGKQGFFENMGGHPITSKDWQPYEIVGKIDRDAAVINFGMMLVGQGKAWMSDASFDVLP